MKIEVWELPELLHMLNAEIYRETTVKTDQEHTMDCERSWEEGYDKGYQDAKNELKDLTEKKAISTQMHLEDLTPAFPIDVITEERINRHFCIPPEHFGHHGLLYKLSKKEYCKAMAFINKIYNEHDRNNELTYCYQPVSDGIGIAITIVCDQYPEEREDITDYSRW